MASLPTRTTASFDAIKPVSSLVLLDNEFNQYVGASGIFNGGTTATKLLVKASDATDPPVDQDQIGAGLLARCKQNGSSKATITNDGSLTANGLTGAAGVYTFGSIPVGPASDPTTANQLARKAYVDGKTVSFSAPFTIVDPSTATLNTRQFGCLVIPAGGTYTITLLKVMFREGSHTAGATLTFTFDRSGSGDIGTLNLDNTNNTAGVVYTNNIADITPSVNEIFSVRLTTRSGTITEQNVTAIIEGFRTLI